jgi:hypothetical protein
VSTFYQDQELIANQFTEAENFAIWLKQKMLAYDNTGDWLDYLYENLDIYIAQGHWLDLFGLIIGQSRAVADAIPIDFFGFQSTTNGKAFGVARFWDGQEPLRSSSILADPEYRIVLLAKVAFNYADVTLTGIASSLSIMLETTDITVTNNGVANVDIYIGKVLTDTQKALVVSLDLIPVGAGISADITFA